MGVLIPIRFFLQTLNDLDNRNGIEHFHSRRFFFKYSLQHYRNVLKCMQLIQINTEHDDDDFEALSHIVHEMQVRYVR